MARHKVFQGGPDDEDDGPPAGSGSAFNPDDEQFDDELRPQGLDEVVGQRKVVERLRIVLDAARMRKEPLGHLLLDGPPGLGKTTLAMAMAREMGVECQITSGPALQAPKDLLSYLTNAAQGSVLFIDEIHRLPPTVEEFIYPVMEDFRVDIVLGEGLSARTINMKLKRFTIVGATTRSGMLTAPLRDRFVVREHLDFYEIDDLSEIVRRNALKLRTTTTEDSALQLASRSRGTPRKANNLLRWARDFATVHEPEGRITDEVVKRALAMLEVDHLGLEAQDRRYLQTIVSVFSGGPAGLNAIGHTMNVPPDTLEDEVEPFLLQCGFIQRTPRGRVITASGLEHLGQHPPKGPGQRELF
ncbi:Holliday junction branch migration DNA helicase RuvB [Planctellipticum variicoloris]|uniref:Holliday junction branch migration DNA helicase RuvB n=1 Tax=Planctellipticum variicoloris TaxID=3064265 RepID=UPI002CF9C539|nr:Holliday junction branch migration DNA helicase RuvB [Planctomycetaceae bacterium SH412]HTN01955.1 Holliday junction branch migration DNA helicase RuvB [Planctomycetaceae bacterium]